MKGNFSEAENVRSGKEITLDSYKLQLRYLYTHVVSVRLTEVKGKIYAVLELSKEEKKKRSFYLAAEISVTVKSLEYTNKF